MILSVTAFEVNPGESLRYVGSYVVAEAETLAGLDNQLQVYLARLGSEGYHGRVTRWFDNCVSSGALTELNIGNGPRYIHRWIVEES